MAEITIVGTPIGPVPGIDLTPLAEGPIPDYHWVGLLGQYLAQPTAVSLIRYCQILGIDERQFYWVEDPPTHGTEFYWKGTERRQLQEELLKAEQLIESELGVFLWHKWVRDEQQDYGYPLLLEWGKYVCAGAMDAQLYAATSDVDYSTADIGVVTVAHGDLGSISEVRCFYYDSDVPQRLYRLLHPTDVDWGIANIVLTFPKWRLVRPELMNSGPLDINDDSNFVEQVLVARQYSDQSDQATFVGVTSTQTGYLQCDMDSISKVRITAGVYDAAAAAWGRSAVCFTPRYVLIKYKAGLPWLPFDLEQAVVRLAHSFMPEPPCPSGHDPWVRYWHRDRFIPATMSKEQINCKWGQSNGAFFAWNVVSNSPYHIRRGGAISL